MHSARSPRLVSSSVRWGVQEILLQATTLRLKAVVHSTGVTSTDTPSKGSVTAIRVIQDSLASVFSMRAREKKWTVSPLSLLLIV